MQSTAPISQSSSFLFVLKGIYQIHWPTPLANEGYWDGLARCYNRGTCYVLIKRRYISNSMNESYVLCMIMTMIVVFNAVVDDDKMSI
jgi:hypothetical protein